MTKLAMANDGPASLDRGIPSIGPSSMGGGGGGGSGRGGGVVDHLLVEEVPTRVSLLDEGPPPRRPGLWDSLKEFQFQRAPFNSQGQPVFSDGRRYITPDIDQHFRGVWKMFEIRGGKPYRLGTYDASPNRIGN